jgi:hypothetical protein
VWLDEPIYELKTVLVLLIALSEYRFKLGDMYFCAPELHSANGSNVTYCIFDLIIVIYALN